MNSGKQNRLKQNHFDRVSPTAWLTAYRRAIAGIPYAQDFFDELEKIRKDVGGTESSLDLNLEITPQIEARYLLVNYLIARFAPQRILEIAAGFSSRGFAMAEASPVQYVEVDLPQMIERKKKIIRAITRKLGKKNPKNLYLKNGDALRLSDLLKALSHFHDNRPLLVVNEGFMRYLNFQEKKVFTKNIYSLLKQRGGIWITPDITLKEFFEGKNIIQNIKDVTGIDLQKNYFVDENHAKNFFESEGFVVERHSFLEVFDQLKSPSALNFNQNKTRKQIGAAVAFVMKIRGPGF